MKIFKCGDRHEGIYAEGKREGYGVYVWTSGDMYEGMWKGGRMAGRGIKTLQGGAVYDGEWQENRSEVGLLVLRAYRLVYVRLECGRISQTWI